MLAWAALWLNVLAYQGPSALMPIPTPIGQLITQGMAPVGLVLALLANPRAVIRPSIVLALISTMGVAALMASIQSEFFIGSTYRAVRLVIFVIVLWLLTPWFGRPSLPLLRAHFTCLRVILYSILIGLPAWGLVHVDGRLRGALWPIPPPQVGHYAAVLLGCTAVLWFTGVIRQRTMLITLLAAGFALLDSHTRTALAGLLIGLIVAGASLFLGHARVRRTAAVVTAMVAFIGSLFAPFILAWLSRGQDAQEAAQLTGRTKVWSAVISQDRTWMQKAFGDGLSNKSFNGLPIDSNWVATYLDQGLFGAALIVAFLVALLLTAMTRPRGPRRALALFVVAYCIVASFTETGLGDASPYLLDIVVAASVLATAPGTTRI